MSRLFSIKNWPIDCDNCLLFADCNKTDVDSCPNCLTNQGECKFECDIPGLCKVCWADF